MTTTSRKRMDKTLAFKADETVKAKLRLLAEESNRSEGEVLRQLVKAAKPRMLLLTKTELEEAAAIGQAPLDPGERLEYAVNLIQAAAAILRANKQLEPSKAVEITPITQAS